MRIKTVLVPLIAGAIFLFACNKNVVSLSYTNAKGEVPMLGNLSFRFNQTMVKDSMLNTWDWTDYVSFEPAIKGKFRWESPDQLIFSPSQPLNPATTYKAKIKNTVLKFSKYNDVKDADKIDFHTPDLSLDNSQIAWMGETSTSAVPQVDLFFNYRINPQELKDRFKIEVEGKTMDFNVVTVSPDNKVSIRINGLKNEDKDFNAKIIIDKGLKPEAGSNATTGPITASLTAPSPYVLTIQNVESQHEGMEGIVKVTTSQQLAGENLKPYIKFDPELSYTVESNENGFTLRSDKFDVDKSYILTIVKGLRGKVGGILKEDFEGSVAFGELEANIRFTNSKAVYLSKNGGKNIEVQITNVPKVKLIISKIYENNLLMSQRYGYYPQETRAIQASYEKEIETRSLPKSGAGRLLNFSQFEDRLPDFKGVYHIVIRSAEDYWVKDSRFVSLSDIGLITKEGQDKIYVFTNSIKTALPVDGVNISIYSSNNQLLGSSATNREGVAEIAYSKKDFAGFKPAMVI